VSSPAIPTAAGPLAGLRVLDLAHESGALAGKILGDLGADVVAIEPPAGLPSRAIGPFWHDAPHPDRSLFHWTYATSKRSAVLDLATAQGRDAFLRLADGADVVIESGTLDALGLGPETLRAARPRLVVTSITPFGRTGPWRDRLGSDLVGSALAGMLYVNGAPAGKPLRPLGPQAFHCAGVTAAIAILAALRVRERDGCGQLVDVSVLEATTAAVEHVAAFYRQTGAVHRRTGSLHWTRYFRVGRCRDGWLMHCTLGDWTSLVSWMAGDGFGTDLLGEEWENINHRRAHAEHLFDTLDGWGAGQAVHEVMEGAQLRRIPYAVVRTVGELLGDPQLAARGFFVPVVHPELGATVRHAGAPYVFGRTPWAIRRRPPLLGEHTREVLDEAARAPRPTRPPPAPSPAATAPRRALDGIVVLDFTWVVAGPVATRILADHGARVVKVERRDATDFGDRRGGMSGNLNRGKESIILVMSHSEGLALARRLVARADVVIDNFSARVMRNWGLDYEGLRAIRPDVIAVAMSGFGLTGPERDYVSYGPTLQALAGYTAAMRDEDGTPIGWGYSYADMAAGHTAALATFAALHHRTVTGEGQLVDVAQFENTSALLGPALLDATVHGRGEPSAAASPEGTAAPYGIYPCRGDDRWCAISVLSDAHWRALRRALGDPAWAADSVLATTAGRVARAVDLDVRLAEWTGTRDAEDVMERLQRAGVPAGIVANAVDLCERDPQLAARGYWESAATPEGTTLAFDGVASRLSANPGRVSGPGPLLGEHGERVLADLLGCDAAEIARLRGLGVLG
jgi:crotonobetainyl-CoA:carnitine CoA-transferase CaiB-like acyl-CoA transferase